ncbi:hypothetical protein BCR44DRAFT_1446396 [Catenaria anguillulae PL171]|uniref:Uncharacterized protein n=1 Tax=Catenaria anguillulae PL171 TaxID=765915 RepID=A0A1Y2H655_9FUNG|nr:hypothetical protein BCR44DRAFT_1446396 [Catenaria anguillulae PL171]
MSASPPVPSIPTGSAGSGNANGGDQPPSSPNSSNTSSTTNVTFPLGSCCRLPLDLGPLPAHRASIDSAILQSPQQLAFRGCIVFPFGTLTGGLDVLFFARTEQFTCSRPLLRSSARQRRQPSLVLQPALRWPCRRAQAKNAPSVGLANQRPHCRHVGRPSPRRPHSSIVGPLTCSSRRPATMPDADPSSSAPQAPTSSPSLPAAPMSASDDVLVIVLATFSGIVALLLLAWIFARGTYSDHEVLVSPRFVSPPTAPVPMSPYTTGAGSMTAVVIDSPAKITKPGGHGGAKLLTSDTTDDITVVIRDTPMSGATTLDHGVEQVAAWGVCISPSPSNVGSLLSPCSDRSADSLLALPPLHMHEQKHHHLHHPNSLDVDRPVRSPTATAGSLLRRSLSIGRRERGSGLIRKSSTRRSKSNDSSSSPSQMDLAGCSVTLSSFGLRPCPPAARRPTSGKRGHNKHDDPNESHTTPPPTYSLSNDSRALLTDWFSMFQDLNDVATAYVGSAGRQHRAVVLVRLSSLLRPFLDNVISDQLYALSHGLNSASPSPVAPKPKYLHFLFQDVLASSPSEDPIALVVNKAIATFLADLTHAFPSLARSQVPRGTRYDTWSEYLWTQAMRWYRIKAQRPFAALVEPQPGSQVRERLMVVVGRAEELDEELGCEPSPPRASELVGAAEYEREHGDLDSHEDEAVVAWCVFPALVDLARSKVIAKARVYVGVDSGAVE